MPADLGPLLDHLPVWLMVLFRLTGIFLIAPMLGSPALLRPVKVLLVLGLSFCIYPMLLEPGTQSASHLTQMLGHEINLFALAAMIGLELLIGLAIGYCATLPLIAMQIGGQLVDQQVFPGASGVFNPETGDDSSVIGEIMFITALAIFVILGGHRVMLITLVASFDHVALGGLADFDALLSLVLGLLTAAFEVGMRIAAPLLCMIFLEMLAMGFIARTVPGVNILSVGFAIRGIMGASLLMMGAGVIVAVYIDALQEMMRQIMTFFTTG